MSVLKKILLVFFSTMLISCASTKTFEISSNDFCEDFYEENSSTNIRNIEVTSTPDYSLAALNLFYTPTITLGSFTLELLIGTFCVAYSEEFTLDFKEWREKNKKRINEISSKIEHLEKLQKNTDYYKYKEYIKPLCKAKIVIDDNYNQNIKYNKINKTTNVLETRTIEVKKDLKISKELVKLKSERFARYVSYGTNITYEIILLALPAALIGCAMFGVFD